MDGQSTTAKVVEVVVLFPQQIRTELLTDDWPAHNEKLHLSRRSDIVDDASILLVDPKMSSLWISLLAVQNLVLDIVVSYPVLSITSIPDWPMP